MIARALRGVLLAVPALALVQGCAVGRFIAGAPSTQNPPAQALLVKRCSGCHEIPDPGQMTAAEWRESLVRMQRRMTLPDSEWEALAKLASESPAGR